MKNLKTFLKNTKFYNAVKWYKKYKAKRKRLSIERFILKFDKEKFIHKKRMNKVMLINEGEHTYFHFTFYFVNDMLSRIVYALYNNYIPVVSVIGSKLGNNIWNDYFIPVYDSEQIAVSELRAKQVFTAGFHTSFEPENIKLWSKIYDDFVLFNDKTKMYVEDEYKKLLLNKGKILGVLIRGTDMVSLKLKNHPIQPDINDVIELCQQKMKENQYNYIYLATEEKKSEELFQAAFPNKIIINKRVYYDGFTWVDHLHRGRESQMKERGLEYLSSMYLLSKCDALIAGNCGGTMAALFMNNLQYEYYHIFNMGFYE